MHLQEHLCAKSLCAHSCIDADHCYLHDVGSRSLYGSIHGVALGISSHHGIAAVDVGEVASAPERRFHVSLLTRHVDTSVDIGLHARIRLEIVFDELLRLLPSHAHPLGKPESGDSVYDAEVGSLCLSTLVLRHVADVLVEDARRRCRVDVGARVKRLDECGILAQVRHDAQLNLAVVGSKEHLSLLRHEGTANLASVLASHGYVLQVRVRRRQSPRCRHGLVEGSVYVPRVWAHKPRQGFDVCAQQFFQPSVGKYLLHDGVLRAQLLQNLLGGAVLSAFRLFRLVREVQLAKENLADLPWRGYEERMSCKGIHLFLDLQHACRKVLAYLPERLCVEAHSVPLHSRKDKDERHLYLAENALDGRLLRQFRSEFLLQTQRDVGLLACSLVALCRRRILHAEAQERIAEIVHPVLLLGLKDVVRKHGVEDAACEFHSIMRQDGDGVLRIVHYLLDVRRLQQRLQSTKRRLRGLVVSRIALQRPRFALGDRNAYVRESRIEG